MKAKLLSDWFSDTEDSTRPVQFVISNLGDLQRIVTEATETLRGLPSANFLSLESSEHFSAYVASGNFETFEDQSLLALLREGQMPNALEGGFETLDGEQSLIVYPDGQFKLRLENEYDEGFVDSQRAVIDPHNNSLKIQQGRVKRNEAPDRIPLELA